MFLAFPVETLGVSLKHCITSRTRSKLWWRAMSKRRHAWRRCMAASRADLVRPRRSWPLPRCVARLPMRRSRASTIQIDVEPRNAGWVFPINLGLIGDAKAVLQQLNDALADDIKKRPTYTQQPRFARLQQDKKE